MSYYYQCRMKEDGHMVSWTAGIDTLRMTASGQYEAEINGRGTYFHVITGQHKYGAFLCIPNHDICCELADFSDIRWTIGRLSMHPIRKVDAITVAAGISHLEKAVAASRKK